MPREVTVQVGRMSDIVLVKSHHVVIQANTSLTTASLTDLLQIWFIGVQICSM